MFFYILIVFAIVVILLMLIGLYYFSKQQYDNFYVSLLLDKNKLILLKSNKINQIKYKTIKFILNIRTILLIVLATTAIYIFKSDNIAFRYIVIVLLFANQIISNKLIENIFNKKEI